MPKIIETVKSDTLVTNEPLDFERAEFDSDSQLGSNYQNYDYISFADNGDIYAIDGDSASRAWRATLFELKGSAAPTSDRYKAIRNVVEVKPGGLTKPYETRKALIAAIESGDLQFVKSRDQNQVKARDSSSQATPNPALSRYEKPVATSQQRGSSSGPKEWSLASKIFVGVCVVIAIVVLITAFVS